MKSRARTQWASEETGEAESSLHSLPSLSLTRHSVSCEDMGRMLCKTLLILYPIAHSATMYKNFSKYAAKYPALCSPRQSSTKFKTQEAATFRAWRCLLSRERRAGVRVLGEHDSPLGTILDSKAEPRLFLRTADPLHTLAHQPSKAHEASRPLFF